jgi:hypothetical protein
MHRLHEEVQRDGIRLVLGSHLLCVLRPITSYGFIARGGELRLNQLSGCRIVFDYNFVCAAVGPVFW